MSKGMEMMMSALKSMVPDNIWALVEKNIITMGEKVTSIERDQKETKEMLLEIKGLLNTQFGPLARRPFQTLEVETNAPSQSPNGTA